MKKHLFTTLLLLIISIAMQAQTASSLKWSDICNGKMPADWYGSEEAQQIADVVLSVQKNTGGWMKNDQLHKLSDSEKQALINARSAHSCLDNSATTMEMRFLAKVYQKTKVEKYKEAFTKALNMIFTAEKGCGGWSQYWPLSGNGSYQDYITFNDDLITNVMKLLQEIATNKGDFADITDESTRKKCEQSFERAIDVIIKCQVDDNGTPAAWCAQHDTITFLPTEGRPHELPSISAYESADLLSYLMTIEKPSEQLQQTIHTAVDWLDKHKIDGKAVEDFTNSNGEEDRRIVEKAGSAVWGRFIQLGGATGERTYNAFFNKLKDRNKKRSYYQNGKTYTYTEYEIATKSYDAEKAYQPIFAIYDDQIQHLYYRFLYTYEDAPETTDWQGCSVPTSLNAVRRVNYQFMGSWPLNVIKTEYPAWKQRIEAQSTSGEYSTYIISAATTNASKEDQKYDFVSNEKTFTMTNAGGKGYGAGTTASKTFKFSNNVLYSLSIPEDLKITKIVFTGYTNEDGQTGYVKEICGKAYDETYGTFPARDKDGDSKNPPMNDVEIDVSASPIMGTLTLKTFKQLALRLTLTATSATGIDSTITIDSQNNAPIYNLQGIRVEHPQKGIFIQNGKKIVIP